MSPKRLRATTIATVFVLSVLGPRPPGVWADSRANCTAGWEWVCSSVLLHVAFVPVPASAYIFFVCAHVAYALCRIGIQLGKIHVVLFPPLRPRVEEMVRSLRESPELINGGNLLF